MAYTHNLFTTYDSAYADTEVIGLASYIDEPITTSWDLFPEGGDPVMTPTINWYDGSSFSMVGAIPSGSSWTSSGTTSLAVSSATADLLNIGDMLKVEDEYVIVKDVSTSADTIDVQARGHGSSSAAAHDASDAAIAVYIVNNAQIEGTVDVEGIVQDSVQIVNYVNTIMDLVEVTFVGKRAKNLDIDDRMADSKLQALKRLYRKMNLGLLMSVGDAGTKSTTSRSAKGLRELIATYGQSYAVGGALTEAKVKAAVALAADKGGTPDTLIVAPREKRVINDFYNSNSFLRIDGPQSTQSFGMILGEYMSEVGPIRIVQDFQLQSAFGNAFLVDSSKIEKRFFVDDPIRFVPEPQLSSSRKEVVSLQGSWTVKATNLASSHVLLTGITA
jgi:hypothetical protein